MTCEPDCRKSDRTKILQHGTPSWSIPLNYSTGQQVRTVGVFGWMLTFASSCVQSFALEIIGSGQATQGLAATVRRSCDDNWVHQPVMNIHNYRLRSFLTAAARISVCLTACRKEAKSSFPLPPSGPYHLEGTTLARPPRRKPSLQTSLINHHANACLPGHRPIRETRIRISEGLTQDSSRFLPFRGGIARSIGKHQEIQTQIFLVCGLLVD